MRNGGLNLENACGNIYSSFFFLFSDMVDLL